MADNRMELRCKGCGATVVLAKMFISTGWYSARSPQQKGQALIDFIEKHQTCCNHIGDIDRHVEFDPNFEPFELVYENNPMTGNRFLAEWQQIKDALPPYGMRVLMHDGIDMHIGWVAKLTREGRKSDDGRGWVYVEEEDDAGWYEVKFAENWWWRKVQAPEAVNNKED